MERYLIKKRKKNESLEAEAEAEEEEEERVEREIPSTFVVTNVNGLFCKIEEKEHRARGEDFKEYVRTCGADVIVAVETWLPGLKSDASKLSDGGDGKQANAYRKSVHDFKNRVLARELKQYEPYYNSLSKKQAGVLVLIKRNKLQPTKVRNYLNEESKDEEHNKGRVVVCEYAEKITFVCTYVPNNGGQEGLSEADKRKRAFRKGFDEDLAKCLQTMRRNGKEFVWMGDLNVAPETIDAHLPGVSEQLRSANPNHGIAGYTRNEQDRFKRCLRETDSIDAYRVLNPDKRSFSRRSVGQVGSGFGYNPAMRLDLFVVSNSLKKAIKKCFHATDHLTDELAATMPKKEFFSDHCPVHLELDFSKLNSSTTEDDDGETKRYI